MFKSLNSKFTMILLLFIIMTVGLPTAYLVLQFRQNFSDRSQLLISESIDLLDLCLNKSMLEGDKDIQNILIDHARSKNIARIRIYDSKGKIKYSNLEKEIGLFIQNIDKKNLASINDANRIITTNHDKNTYLIHEAIFNEKNCRKCHRENENIAYLNLETPFTAAERRFYTGSFHLLYLSVALIGILFTGMYIFFRTTVSVPLNKLMEGMKQIEKGKLGARIDVKGENEFSKVARHFNRMTEQIEASQEELERLHFEQLQRADKLVTLGELAAEMAHEINNPAGVVLTRVDFLDLEATENANLQPFREDLHVIISQMQRISTITGDILKFSKKKPKKKERINLGELVRHGSSILKPRLHKKQIELKYEFECEANCSKARILANPEQIEQAIINILNNAIDSIENKGGISILIKCLEDGAKQLIIQDTGVGMNEETRKNIFTPFFTTKSIERGTGLGLYIVKKICDEHQAEISCFSEPGQGTSFIITFLGERESK
jgi:signal transduction histidine kinase